MPFDGAISSISANTAGLMSSYCCACLRPLQQRKSHESASAIVHAKFQDDDNVAYRVVRAGRAARGDGDGDRMRRTAVRCELSRVAKPISAGERTITEARKRRAGDAHEARR